MVYNHPNIKALSFLGKMLKQSNLVKTGERRGIKLNSNNEVNQIDKKALLSTLWLFVLLNIIFRDLHEFASPGFLTEILSGYVNGIKITENLILIGAIVAQVPIFMVLLSRVLKRKTNRWANIGASIFQIAITISALPRVPADILHAIIEIAALLSIIWIAWKWSIQEE